MMGTWIMFLPQNSVQVYETRVSGWRAGTSPLVTFFRLIFLFKLFVLVFCFLHSNFVDIFYIFFGDINHVDHDHGDLQHGELDHGDYNHGDLRHGDLHHGVLDHGDPGELWWLRLWKAWWPLPWWYRPWFPPPWCDLTHWCFLCTASFLAYVVCGCFFPVTNQLTNRQGDFRVGFDFFAHTCTKDDFWIP